MKLQIFKCEGAAYVVGGFGFLEGTVGETIEFSVIDPIGDEVLTVGGARYVLHDGKVSVKVADIGVENTKMHLWSGGKLYVLDGIERRGDEIRLSDGAIHLYISRLAANAHSLSVKLIAAENRIKKLESICLGDEFL